LAHDDQQANAGGLNVTVIKSSYKPVLYNRVHTTPTRLVAAFVVSYNIECKLHQPDSSRLSRCLRHYIVLRGLSVVVVTRIHVRQDGGLCLLFFRLSVAVVCLGTGCVRLSVFVFDAVFHNVDRGFCHVDEVCDGDDGRA
jgi:hypothetical protein